MKVFVLNLDCDRARWNAVSARLRALGVAFERIPAVLGRELPDAEKRLSVNRFRWWCAVGRPIMNGEIGCALSHSKAYRKILADGLPMACVLEDDVVLDDRFPRVLNYLESKLLAEAKTVVLLSNHTNQKLGEKGDSEVSVVDGLLDMFAEGYVVTSTAAENLLRENSPIVVPADHWPRWTKKGAIQLLHAVPTVCSQNWSGEFQSRTDAPSNLRLVDSLPLPFYVWHKFKRAVGKFIDTVLLKLESGSYRD